MPQEPWTLYAWAGVVLLVLAVGVWAATNRREIRPTLPPEHVAGATILGLFGWQRLVDLPGLLTGYWAASAGIGTVPGLEGPQAFVVAEVAFIVAVAFAVAGILRRRAWGTVLGIALATAIVAWSLVQLAANLQVIGGAATDELFLSLATNAIGLRIVPALVALICLAAPLRRTLMPPAEPAPAWRGEPADRPS